ncbi:MAG: hypothetical protein O2838_04990, partial [Proteobacteria bacterium]|nr:hypothetical protein [Pseudomonadota bacterium]
RGSQYATSASAAAPPPKRNGGGGIHLSGSSRSHTETPSHWLDVSLQSAGPESEISILGLARYDLLSI